MFGLTTVSKNDEPQIEEKVDFIQIPKFDQIRIRKLPKNYLNRSLAVNLTHSKPDFEDRTDSSEESQKKYEESKTKLYNFLLPYFCEKAQLSNKRLADWPYELKNITKLKVLDLSHNGLTEVFSSDTLEIFQKMAQLENVDQSYNKITQISFLAFAYNSSLKKLSIAHNRQSDIQQLKFLNNLPAHSTKSLDVSQNYIKNLSLNKLFRLYSKSFPKLTEISLKQKFLFFDEETNSLYLKTYFPNLIFCEGRRLIANGHEPEAEDTVCLIPSASNSINFGIFLLV